MNAIETQNLGRSFGEHVAVDDLCLAIPKGTVFGFLGPNGAGKTTTVRMLASLIAPSCGSARVCGFTLGERDEEIRRRVGILTETPGLYDSLSALENLIFFARLYDLPSRKARAEAERYLRFLGLWDRRDHAVGGFSKGMRQKLAIARALLHAPEVVFLDEPTSGLDPEASRTVRDFIRQLKQEGRTIFLTTHNLPEADELCDLIGVFKQKLLRLDTPQKLRADLFGSGTRIRVRGGAAPFREVVEGLPFVLGLSVGGDELSVTLASPEEETPPLVRALCQAGADIQYVGPILHSLEEVYLRLIAESPSSREPEQP